MIWLTFCTCRCVYIYSLTSLIMLCLCSLCSGWLYIKPMCSTFVQHLTQDVQVCLDSLSSTNYRYLIIQWCFHPRGLGTPPPPPLNKLLPPPPPYSKTCLQGTLRWGDNLWSGDTFSERCPIFPMLKNLWWRDTCHVGTFSLGYRGVHWRQVSLYL